MQINAIYRLIHKMCDIIPKKIYMYLNKVHVYDTAVTAFYDLFMIRSVTGKLKYIPEAQSS